MPPDATPALPAAAAPPLGQDELLLGLSLAELAVWRLGGERVQGNAPAARLIGASPEQCDWTAAELVERLHPDDRALMREAVARSRLQDQPVDTIVRFQRLDGRWRHAWTRCMAQHRGVGQAGPPLMVALDVSVRQQALDRLRQADQRIALTTHALGIGTWEYVFDADQRRWDDQMFLLRGLPPSPQAPSLAEMINFVHEDDRAVMKQRIAASMHLGIPQTYEFRVKLPDGGLRWLASRSVMISDDQGRPVRRIGVNWDVTESRRAAQVLQEQALAQRESEAKSHLLARLSHELRTPLNAILGFAQLLLDDSQQADAALRERRLRHIYGAGQHLLALVDDVLTLARPDAQPEPLNLSVLALDTLVADTLPLVEQEAARCGVQLRWQPGHCQVRADPLRLRQVLLNLLTNAIKYNQPGGLVQVASGEEAGQVCLRVRDTGIGLPADQLSAVFEPFHRLSRQGTGVEGLGLGLAVVRSLVDAMGGQVSASSEPGQGSEFCVRLPLVPALATGGDASDVPQAGHPGTLRRVLYIEDNAVNVMIMAELLARRGDLDFDSAPDATSGLAKARARVPDLLLLDMQLPDGHGLEVLARLRADPLTQRVPCIAVSANAMPDDIQAALRQGFADYWTKPLDFEVVRRAMDLLLGTPARASAD